MNTPVYKMLICLYLIVSMGTSSMAQEEGISSLSAEDRRFAESLPEIPDNQTRVTGEVAFSVFAYNKPSEDYFYYRDGKPEIIRFNIGAIRSFQYGKFVEEIVFYSKQVNQKNQIVLLPVARVQLQAGQSDGIIVFNPVNQEGTTRMLQSLPFIDISPRQFKKSDVKLINATNKDLIVKLDKEVVPLAPMQNIKANFEDGTNIFPVKVGAKNDGKQSVFYSNRFPHEPNYRVLFIIVTDLNNRNGSRPVRCLVYKDIGRVAG